MMQQNPEMVRQMMESPMVQGMLNDPETMRMMLRMNPQLNQLMESRPEIARMLEDPELLRQAMQMATNPSLAREMQRNADTAMGRLDAMPGGHNALVNAHQQFSDPLFEALTGSQNTPAQNLNTYKQQTGGPMTSEAMP